MADRDIVELEDEIVEYTKKVNLAKADITAFEELSSQQIQSNQAIILALREENKSLHKKYQDRISADEKIIGEAFGNNEIHLIQQVVASKATPDKKHELASRNKRIRSADDKIKSFLRQKPAHEAVEALDQFLADAKKRLNQEKSATKRKASNLESLKAKYEDLIREASFAEEMKEGANQKAVKLHRLENELELAKRKTAEATEIRAIYNHILVFLEKSSANYHNELGDLEAKIKRTQKELKKVRKIFMHATKVKDQTRQMLDENENKLILQREENEVKLSKKREQAAKVQREARRENQKRPMVTFSPNSEGSQAGLAKKSTAPFTGGSNEPPRGILSQNSVYSEAASDIFNDNQKIEELNNIFEKVKLCTGVSSLDMVVSRFESQEATKQELEKTQEENNKKKSELFDKLLAAKTKLTEMKYGGTGSKTMEYELLIKANEEKYQISLLKDKAAEAEEKAKAKSDLSNLLVMSIGNLMKKLQRSQLDSSEVEENLKKERLQKATKMAERRRGSVGLSQSDSDNALPVPGGPSSVIGSPTLEEIRAIGAPLNNTNVDDYFKKCNERIEKLIKGLPTGEELDSLLKRIERDENYQTAVEFKLQPGQRRQSKIKNPMASSSSGEGQAQSRNSVIVNKSGRPADDSDSGEDDIEYASRANLKKQREMLLLQKGPGKKR